MRRRKVGVAESGKHQERCRPRAVWWLSTPGLIFTLHFGFASIWEEGSRFGRLGVEELPPRGGWGGVLLLGPGLTSLPQARRDRIEGCIHA